MGSNNQMHLRDALRRIIAKSESRARRRFASDALGLARRYGLFDAFLKEMRLELAIGRSLNIAFIPLHEPGIFCSYLLESADSAKILMEEKGQNILEHLKISFNEGDEYAWFKYSPKAVGIRSRKEQAAMEALDELQRVVHDLHLDSECTVVLAVSLQVPDEWVSEEPQLASLGGVMILWGRESDLPQRNESAEVAKVRSVHRRYLSQARKLLHLDPTSALQGGLFTSQWGIWEGSLRQRIVLLGITNAVYILLHRIGNFVQEGQYIAEAFSSADKVAQRPREFERHIQNLRIQVNQLTRLKESLAHISRHPQVLPITVAELCDIFKYEVDILTKEQGVNVQIEMPTPASDLLSKRVAHPPSLIEELFAIHIENALREIKRPQVKDKRLILIVDEEDDYICFRMINYGPAIPPDILMDLRRVIRVQRPQRTGLGVFLSSVIMHQIGGEVEVESPVKDGIGACFIFKFPKWR